MDELQADIELPFAALPWPAAFFQPRERAFDDPALRQYHKRMEFIALDDLYGGLDPLHHAVCRGLAGVAPINQQALDPFQIRLAAIDGLQSAVPIGHLRHGHGDGVGQSLCVHCDVTLNAGGLLACIVSLLFGAVGVLHALRVNDHEAGRGVAPLFLVGLANGFFQARSRALLPSGPGSLHPRNTNTPSPT